MPRNDEIPYGCHFDRHRWVRPPGPKPSKEETRRLQRLVGRRDLELALKRYLGCRRALELAQRAMANATLYLRVAHSRVDALDLPRPPWLYDDHVVDWDGRRYRVTVANRVSTASNKEGTE